MAQKINPIALRCPSPHKKYTDCWYSDMFYTALQLKKLKLAKHLQGMLKQKGLPEGQISLAAGTKSHRYLLCALNPLESRMHKSLRYRVRPQKSENLRNIIRETDTNTLDVYKNVSSNVHADQTRVLPTPESVKTKKEKAIRHALVASIVNGHTSQEQAALVKTYTDQTTSDLSLWSAEIFNTFGSLYNKIATGVDVWTSGWESQHADFIAQEIAYALTRRVSFRTIKLQLTQELELNTSKAWGSVRGIRVTCAGRGNQKSKKAQRAKTVRFQWGQTSLHVFSEKVGFSSRPALTSFGKIGVKVWVCYK